MRRTWPQDRMRRRRRAARWRVTIRRTRICILARGLPIRSLVMPMGVASTAPSIDLDAPDARPGRRTPAIARTLDAAIRLGGEGPAARSAAATVRRGRTPGRAARFGGRAAAAALRAAQRPGFRSLRVPSGPPRAGGRDRGRRRRTPEEEARVRIRRRARPARIRRRRQREGNRRAGEFPGREHGQGACARCASRGASASPRPSTTWSRSAWMRCR